MKKIFLLASISCLLSTNAKAEEIYNFNPQFYGAARLNHNLSDYDYSEKGEGYSFKQSLDDKTFGGSLALGTKINVIRAEVEGFYNQKGKDAFNYYGFKVPTEIDTKGIFLNGYYDINTNSKFTPYITVGIGYTWLKASTENSNIINGYYIESQSSDKDHSISWNAGLGLSYSLDENSNIDLGYKYINYGDFGDSYSNFKVKSNTLTLGYRYTF